MVGHIPSFFTVTPLITILLGTFLFVSGERNISDDLDFPPDHIPLHSNQGRACRDDEKCDSIQCWGYEKNCKFENSFSSRTIKCPGNSNWPSARTKSDQIRLFWRQGDFGYLGERMKDLVDLCTSHPEDEDGSFLSCSDHLRYCYGKNFFFDFKSLKAQTSTNKYREDVINEGEAGGRCTKKLDKMYLKARADHKSHLQSWASELLPFESRDDFRLDDKHCDIIYEKPTVLMKLDAAVNMYHHFCDFVNLYASQHINGSFNRDVNIVLWDTSVHGYHDPTFGLIWEVFSALPLIQLKDLDGKKVCFREAMMPLLARQQLGFFYNMPIVNGCHGSGFFHAFSSHALHRLRIKQLGPIKRKIRVSLLSRATKYRRMLNEEDLLGALKTVVEYDVRKLEYNFRMPFRDQLESTHNTDIFIGMHGSGLTHLLFLPDWGGIFEIYNCEDEGCYRDLAALRGVNYRTWEKKTKLVQEDEGHHPTLGAHAKFTNYAFDIEEFLRIVGEMADHVRNHPLYQKEQNRLDDDEGRMDRRINDEL